MKDRQLIDFCLIRLFVKSVVMIKINIVDKRHYKLKSPQVSNKNTLILVWTFDHKDPYRENKVRTI